MKRSEAGRVKSERTSALAAGLDESCKREWEGGRGSRFAAKGSHQFEDERRLLRVSDLRRVGC